MTARVDAQAAKERAEAWLADTEAGGVTDHSTPASLARDVLALAARLEAVTAVSIARGELIDELEDRLEAAETALREIAATARWYADNGSRLAHEVDHALCVEILSTAEDAVAALAAGRGEHG